MVHATTLRVATATVQRHRLLMNILVAGGIAAVAYVWLHAPATGMRDMSLPQLVIGALGLLSVAAGYRAGFFLTDPHVVLARTLIDLGLAPLTAAEVQSLRFASRRSPALEEAIDVRLDAGLPLYTRDLRAALDHLTALRLPLPAVDDDFLRLPQLAAEVAS